MLATNAVHIGDARELAAQLAPQSVNAVITSPPYFGLRSYLASDHPDKAREMGSETTPDEFVAALVGLFAALRPALRDDGTVWLNLGDSYATTPAGKVGTDPCATTTLGGGLRNARAANSTAAHRRLSYGIPEKNLIGIPWRVAFALQANGWILRSDCIWHKPNPMPESVTDRPTRSHEYLFLLSKGPRYFYDAAAIAEPCVAGYNGSSFTTGKTAAPRANVGQGPRNDGETRNKRSVWSVPTAQFSDAHFATFPPELVRPCIRAGCPVGGTVLDPFMGSGTTAMVAVEEGRNWVGFDLDERAIGWTEGRLRALPVRSLFAEVSA